jgi:YHS domain-containing protein
MPRFGGIGFFLAAIAVLFDGPSRSCLAQGGIPEHRELPAAMAPLEYLIGRWKGQAVPRDNPAQQFRGWTETHSWAWLFAGGKPVGLSLTIEGSKLFERATVTFDAKARRYRLEGKRPGGQGEAILFEGTLDRSGKLLTLERAGQAGRERLTLRANSNYVRYTMVLDRKEEGATLFRPAIEVGLTREGESFAAGSSSVERPKCIITGGAATMTVSYQGRTFPICCTGCRDEFVENPEKYLKLLSARSKAAPAKARTGTPTGSSVSRFEDAFAGDVELPTTKPPGTIDRGETSASDVNEQAADQKKTALKARPRALIPEELSSRGATLLRMGQNLEKSGKMSAALKQYRQVIKESPGTPTAKTAAQRIKSLEGP